MRTLRVRLPNEKCRSPSEFIVRRYRRPRTYARIAVARLFGGCIASICDPDTPVMSRVPRWNVT